MAVSEKGPFKTITHKGNSVYVYHTPSKKKGKTYDSYTLIYTQAGKRKRKSIAKEKKALETAKTIAEQLAEGTGHAVVLTPEEVADYTAALKILRKFPETSLASVCQQYADALEDLGKHGTIRDAVSSHLRVSHGSTLKAIRVTDLIENFIEDKTKEKLSEFYLKDLEYKLKRFGGDFQCNISSIQSADINRWLSKKASGRNANNLLSSISTLFSYAQENGYLAADTKHSAEQIKKKKEETISIGIYSPEEIRKILHSCDKGLIPTISIAAFAGLRSTEIFRLDWKDIKINRDHIVVEANKAKTASRRIVPIMPVLKAWLSSHEKKVGRVCPDYVRLNNLTRKFGSICKKAGVEVKQNGFRHSFASYRLATIKSAAQVALEMGNSPQKLFTNYRELVGEDDAKEWFGLTPAKVKKHKAPEKKPASPKAAKSPKLRSKAPSR